VVKCFKTTKSTARQPQKNGTLLQEVIPLMENGRPADNVTANVLSRSTDGTIIVQLAPANGQ